MNVTRLREGFAVLYEVYEEIEPRYVGCGVPEVLREQVRFRFTTIMFYN